MDGRAPMITILDHWEMCSNRNGNVDQAIHECILDHWEMCSNRNRLTMPGSKARDFRSLGNVL